MKTLSKIFQALLGVVALSLTALIAGGRLAWRSIRNRWKIASKWVRRTIVTSFFLIALAFAALVAYAIYDDTMGRWYSDKRLSDDVVVYYFADDTYRVYNKSTEKYTTPRIDWVTDAASGDSLGVYAVGGRRGYINVKNGEIIINAKTNDYEKAWVFSDGLAAVMKDGKVGFIDANNKLVIPFRFDYSDKCIMYEIGYLFHDGYCVMTNKDGKFGLIDISGNWVVEPEYDELWNAHKTGNRIVVNDGKHGVLDSCGNVVYPTEYFYIDVLSDGFVLTKDGKKWQVDIEGNVVNPFLFDGSRYIEYPISYSDNNGVEYALSDYMEYYVNSNSGIMNRITGKPITPALYDDVYMMSDKLFKVQDAETYDWYIIDINGNRVN